MGKINGKQILVIGLLALLAYSRFINLGWGLPYPMHPDERNMATAIQQLNCQSPVISLNLPKSIFGNWEPVSTWFKIIKPFDFLNCFNPHFFAYSQFPLYLGYLIVFILKFFDGDMGFPISFDEAVLSLRLISAVASIINFIIIIKIINFIIQKKSLLSYLIIIFSPYAIQFAHFGTTESLLMMFYSGIIYLSLLFIDKNISTSAFVANSSIVVGLSLATKVSSAIFLIVPFTVLLFSFEELKLKTSLYKSKNLFIFFAYRFVSKIIDLSVFAFLTVVIFIFFSPHNFINFKDFISSMNYESEVALGRSLVFYTRQFFNTVPVLFQLDKIFPYVLGWPIFLMGIIGLIGLNWKDKKINLLRFTFLVYFIPSAFIYAKWSRFMAPILPLITIFAILFLLRIKVINFIKIIIVIIAILPGLAYLSVYQNLDVRYKASEWIYKNIPNNSYILFETANVVDVPINNETMKQLNNYNAVSFNFYDLDISKELQSRLISEIEKADYIFIPSRRIFANHPKKTYPVLNKYYEDLFSGKLGFEKVAEFDSFPKICLPFTNNCLEFPDEEAEETWTVFDHPVIRIYKRVVKKS